MSNDEYKLPNILSNQGCAGPEDSPKGEDDTEPPKGEDDTETGEEHEDTAADAKADEAEVEEVDVQSHSLDSLRSKFRKGND